MTIPAISEKGGVMSEPLKVLSLFAGIGGFDLGLERAGMKVVAQCEIDPFCRQVLAKHWPEVPCYEDVRTLTADQLTADGIAVDVICGGFPCQDISISGKQAGPVEGSRSGLWSEIARSISELRPSYVVVENVSNLLAGPNDQPGAWFGRVLGDLAALGYDAEWHCIPAADVGAPDIRDRVWIIAYPQHTDTHSLGSHSEDLNINRGSELRDQQVGILGPVLSSLPRCGERMGSGPFGEWSPEPRICRVVERTPDVVDRLKALGNTVKPVIPEIIGRAIIAAHTHQRSAA